MRIFFTHEMHLSYHFCNCPVSACLEIYHPNVNTSLRNLANSYQVTCSNSSLQQNVGIKLSELDLTYDSGEKTVGALITLFEV